MFVRTSFFPLLAWTVAAALTSLAACGDGGDTSTTTAETSSTGSTSSPSPTSSPTTTDTASDVSTGDASSSAGDTSTGAGDTTGSAGDTTGAVDSTGLVSDGTTAPPPTDGPGVLPGESGLEAFCRRFFECGGGYYQDEQDCLDASYNYWGDCPSRKAALDDFGACMSEIDCSDWSPDNYNPNSTPCAEQWGDLMASEPC